MPALGAATGDVCPLLTVPADRSAQRYAAGFESSTTALANANASRATASAEAPLDRTSKANGAVSTTTPLAVANSCDARARVEIELGSQAPAARWLKASGDSNVTLSFQAPGRQPPRLS